MAPVRTLYGQVQQAIVKSFIRNKDLWIIYIGQLPSALQNELKYLFFLVKLCSDMTPDLDGDKLAFYMLKTAVCNYKTCSEEVLLKQLFINMLPVSSYREIIRKSKYLLSVDNDFMMYLLPKIDDLIIINNLLIISSYYGNLDVVKLCIKEGGDDFLSAKKAANLTQQYHILTHLNSSNIHLNHKFSNSKSYRIYHRAVDNYNDCCDDVQRQHLNMLRGYFQNARPVDYVPYQISDLGIPMPCWGELNIFRLMCSLHINKTSYLGCFAKHIDRHKKVTD